MVKAKMSVLVVGAPGKFAGLIVSMPKRAQSAALYGTRHPDSARAKGAQEIAVGYLRDLKSLAQVLVLQSSHVLSTKSRCGIYSRRSFVVYGLKPALPSLYESHPLERRSSERWSSNLRLT